MIAAAIWCHSVGAPWWFWLLLGGAGLFLGVVGAFGRREYMEREIKKLKEEAPVRVVDAILNALI